MKGFLLCLLCVASLLATSAGQEVEIGNVEITTPDVDCSKCCTLVGQPKGFCKRSQPELCQCSSARRSHKVKGAQYNVRSDVESVQEGQSQLRLLPPQSCHTYVYLTFNTDEFPEDISWTLSDANSNTTLDSVSAGTYLTQFGTITENLCIPECDQSYTLKINDEYYDGLTSYLYAGATPIPPGAAYPGFSIAVGNNPLPAYSSPPDQQYASVTLNLSVQCALPNLER